MRSRRATRCGSPKLKDAFISADGSCNAKAPLSIPVWAELRKRSEAVVLTLIRLRINRVGIPKDDLRRRP